MVAKVGVVCMCVCVFVQGGVGQGWEVVCGEGKQKGEGVGGCWVAEL